MNDIVATLVDRFRLEDLNTMRSSPSYNNALNVEAVDFQETFIENQLKAWIGALITPWCINVILLTERFEKLVALGQHVKHQLPSGEHMFIVAEDKIIGRYDFLKLETSVLKYKTQSSARAVARAGLQKLLVPAEEHNTTPLPRSMYIVRSTEPGAAHTIDRRSVPRRRLRHG